MAMNMLASSGVVGQHLYIQLSSEIELSDLVLDRAVCMLNAVITVAGEMLQKLTIPRLSQAFINYKIHFWESCSLQYI